MAILLLRDSDRGADYQVGDIVQAFADTEMCNLPPASPFWIVKITGLSVADAIALQRSEYDANGVLLKKRVWQLRQNRVPSAVKNYLLLKRFVGFGSAADQALYGAVVSGDLVVNWSEAGTWLYNKTTRQYAV